MPIRASSFTPPTDRAWARILGRARRLFPVPFPLRIVRSKRKPSWAEDCYDAGISVDHTGNTVDGVSVWLHASHSRAALVDCLFHELAHVLCIYDDAPHGLKLLHDDAFWIKHGQIFRAWMRDKYGPDEV